MRIAYFDCFCGVSGNMILGALLDAGLSQTDLEADLSSLNLDGWRLEVSKGNRRGMSGTHVRVIQTQTEHVHRNIRDIERIVTSAALPVEVRDRAMQAFERIAKAEARVHGVPETEVHFHEVGAIDAIIDVVGAMAGLYRLAPDTVWVSPIHVGTGFVDAAHGRIPVPAPATLEILKGAPVYATDVSGELATPTGAAILRSVAAEFGPWPRMRVEQIGYGLGTKDFPIPNVLRLAIGHLHASGHSPSSTEPAPRHSHGSGPHSHSHCHHHQDEPHSASACKGCGECQSQPNDLAHGLECDEVEVLEANLDDMNPEFAEHIAGQLLHEGALDVFFTPVIMKKGRPALQLTVLSPPAAVGECVSVILRETTTLGVRRHLAQRDKLRRGWVDVDLAGQSVRVKLGRWGDEVVNIAPEYDDCVRAAAELGRTLKSVYDGAKATALAMLAEGSA